MDTNYDGFVSTPEWSVYYRTNANPADISVDRKPWLFCFHGNSGCHLTFVETLKWEDFVVVAFDLPGCGRSSRLREYSMEIIGDITSQCVAEFIDSDMSLFSLVTL